MISPTKSLASVTAAHFTQPLFPTKTCTRKRNTAIKLQKLIENVWPSRMGDSWEIHNSPKAWANMMVFTSIVGPNMWLSALTNQSWWLVDLQKVELFVDHGGSTTRYYKCFSVCPIQPPSPSISNPITVPGASENDRSTTARGYPGGPSTLPALGRCWKEVVGGWRTTFLADLGWSHHHDIKITI